MSVLDAPRTYRGLLHLYPKDFRAHYADDMADLFAEQLHDESRARVWGRALLDLVLTIPAQHMETHMKRSTTNTMVAIFAVVAVAGVAFAVVGGANVGTAAIGLCVAVASTTLAIITRRRANFHTSRVLASENWWKFALSGAGLLGTVALSTTLAGDLNAPMWATAMIALLAAITAMVIAVMLAATHLMQHRSRNA